MSARYDRASSIPILPSTATKMVVIREYLQNNFL